MPPKSATHHQLNSIYGGGLPEMPPAQPTVAAPDPPVEMSASSTNLVAPKKQRKSAAGRSLIRWDFEKDQLLLLALEFCSSKHGLQLPWDEAVQYVKAGATGQAAIQHLSKVRRAREDAGQPVPPEPLKRRVGKKDQKKRKIIDDDDDFSDEEDYEQPFNGSTKRIVFQPIRKSRSRRRTSVSDNYGATPEASFGGETSTSRRRVKRKTEASQDDLAFHDPDEEWRPAGGNDVPKKKRGRLFGSVAKSEPMIKDEEDDFDRLRPTEEVDYREYRDDQEDKTEGNSYNLNTMAYQKPGVYHGRFGNTSDSYFGQGVAPRYNGPVYGHDGTGSDPFVDSNAPAFPTTFGTMMQTPAAVGQAMNRNYGMTTPQNFSYDVNVHGYNRGPHQFGSQSNANPSSLTNINMRMPSSYQGQSATGLVTPAHSFTSSSAMTPHNAMSNLSFADTSMVKTFGPSLGSTQSISPVYPLPDVIRGNGRGHHGSKNYTYGTNNRHAPTMSLGDFDHLSNRSNTDAQSTQHQWDDHQHDTGVLSKNVHLNAFSATIGDSTPRKSSLNTDKTSESASSGDVTTEPVSYVNTPQPDFSEFSGFFDSNEVPDFAFNDDM